jgi:serine/threonine protein phosphatase 1
MPWAPSGVFSRPESFVALNLIRSPVSQARPKLSAGRRVYAVGDVHGRADLLSALFERIDDDLKAYPSGDSIEVFLGDYIDRGPNSREVIDLLIERRRLHQMMLLKGNHEEIAVRFLDDPTVLSEWKDIGGLTTFLSYGVKPGRHRDAQSQQEAAAALREAIPGSHLLFLQSLMVSFTCGDYFFVHAGARPGIPLNRQSQQDLLSIRDDFLLHEDDFGKFVVHGHTPATEPEIRPNRINIDTGAYATGKLTCLVLEGDQMRFL